jgi:hypothetical protein
MTRAWIGTAILAGSWLLGRDYFSPAHPLAWAAVVFFSVILLSHTPIRWPGRRQQMLALLLTLPALWLLWIPYRAIPLLLCVGLLLQLAPIPRPWPRTLGRGAVVAGTILFAQALILWIYEILTARSHQLPSSLAGVVGTVTRLLGVDATVSGGSIACRSMQEQLCFSATWELLFDPATACFVGGGLVLLRIGNPYLWSTPTGRHWWRRNVTRLLLATAVWIPIRVALLLALILHRTLRADPIAYPNVADILVNSWLHAVLVVVLGFVVARIIFTTASASRQSSDDYSALQAHARAARSQCACPFLIGSGIAVLVFLLFWSPVGQRKSGRVMVVERHSTWEPTTKPYATEVYGEAGSYNYAAAYATCQQYFEMSRLLPTESIDDETLARCDQLIIKTPTARYSSTEIAAVVRFVERGGSLLMIGDHTNVFNMNTYLNDIARHFGFTFRHDLLFRIGSPYQQAYQPPRMAHPIVQHVPPMHFAVSCSIDPGYSLGRMVIRNTGLWSLPPAYHESNYHPQAEYAPNMQYGAWCQLWSTTHGSGRVLAFADSTLFSNFCLFQPGKSELLRSMLDWLDHTSIFDRRGPKLLLLIPGGLTGGLLVILGIRLGRRGEISSLIYLGAALSGWSVALLIATGVHRTRLPVPAKTRPMPQVVIDRTLSEVPLHTGAFSDAEEGVGYGMLEQWIPRIGNITSRRTGKEVFQGDGLVIIGPTRSVDRVYRDRLVKYVRGGGHVLVVDSMEIEGSTANSLLAPFGLASSHDTEHVAEGVLKWSPETAEVALETSCAITGGQTLVRLEKMPVAARVRHGQGSITAIGFGALFNDASMGTHWLPEPEPETLERYDLLYAILRAALPGSTSTEISAAD